jgi:Holliday junction resolvase RusA-like endonuclease
VNLHDDIALCDHCNLLHPRVPTESPMLDTVPPLVFHVPGWPRPQGSLQPARRGDKIIMVEGDYKRARTHKAWRAAVFQHANLAMREHGSWPKLYDGPVHLAVMFTMKRPTSARVGDWFAWKRPDLDKLVRSIGDALGTAEVYREDSRIVVLHVAKRYATRGVDHGGATIAVRIG